MAFMAVHLLSVVLVLFMTGKGSEGLCNRDELNAIFSCISPHNKEFIAHFGTTGTACDHTLINPHFCQLYEEIVNCILGKDLNEKTCIPTAPQQINPLLEIPCKVEDFFSVCTNAPNPWATTTLKGDDTGGCGRKSATQYVWMTSLITTLLAIMKPACNY